MNREETTEAIELFKQEKLDQEKLDAEVPHILQQVDAKILLNFLKNNPNSAQINIINVGKVNSAGNGNHTDILIERLTSEIVELRSKVSEMSKFGLIEWLQELPQPRMKSMMRSLIVTLKEHFPMQKNACQFLGVSERQFSYWMKTYKIPGYRAHNRGKHENEEE